MTGPRFTGPTSPPFFIGKGPPKKDFGKGPGGGPR
jgi:hypothetical protein